MALQVWLPLNGDLHNQGLSGLTATMTGTASIDSSGKIGTCYSFTGSQYLKMTNATIPTTAWSLAAWVYPTADSSSGHQYIVGLNTSTATDFLGVLCYYTNKFGVRTGGTTYSASSTSALNQWYHVAATYNGSVLKLYVNGVEVKSQSSPAAPVAASTVYICARGGGTGSLTFQGKLNDVRIYDHALSAKEVEEIAKGLVLHYKLDNNGMGGENLHKNSFYLTTSWFINQGTVSNGIATITPTEAADRRIYQMPANGAWTWEANTIYTASIEAKSDNGAQLLFYPYGGGASTSAAIPVTSEWKRYSYSFTTSASPGTGSMTYAVSQSSNVTLLLRLPKLEKGSKATVWSPSPSDAIYPTDFKTTIYDSSGYSHNGTIVGSLAAAAGSPRYESATTFPTESSDYFRFPHLVDSTAMNNEFTFSCWLYRDYTDATVRAFYYGLCQIYLYTDFRPRITWQLASADLSYNGKNTWAVGGSTIIPLQEWTHLVFTFNNGILYYYANGVQLGSSDRSSTGQFIRGTQGSPNAAVGYTWIGKISDVRTYATALTADQVKELYNTSMSVDSNGNIYARELSELV